MEVTQQEPRGVYKGAAISGEAISIFGEAAL
jgi:hypothetical protein